MMLVEPSGDYSWLFDLVASDPGTRHQALARHQAALAAASDALDEWNGLWSAHYRSRSSQARLQAAMDEAHARLRRHQGQTIDAPLGAFRDSPDDDLDRRARWAPYAVLYLQWETDHPDEWGARESSMWSRWGTKEVLLHRFRRAGVPEGVEPQLAALTLAALRRPYRCKDWMYAGLVRHFSDPLFFHEVATLTYADDPLVRLRAQFVLQVAEHPERNVTRVSWRRWLDANQLTA